jgi:hypothetical protein
MTCEAAFVISAYILATSTQDDNAFERCLTPRLLILPLTVSRMMLPPQPGLPKPGAYSTDAQFPASVYRVAR